MDMTLDSFLTTYGHYAGLGLIFLGFCFHGLGYKLSHLRLPPSVASNFRNNVKEAAEHAPSSSSENSSPQPGFVLREPGQIPPLAAAGSATASKPRPAPGDVLDPNEEVEFKCCMAGALIKKGQAEGLPLVYEEPQRFDLNGAHWSHLNSSWGLEASGDRRFVAKVIHSPRSDSFDLWDTYERINELRRNRKVFERHLCSARMVPRALEVANEAGRTKSFDVVIMDFIQGETLLDFVMRRVTSDEGRQELRLLATRFRYMIQQFHKEGAVHGDYNGKNIIVGHDGELILVDLDTFCRHLYEPAVSTRGSAGFQCARRSETPRGFEGFGWQVDYFSEWIIYASLVAFVETRSSLVMTGGLYFDLHGKPDDERAKLNHLKSLNNPILTPLVTQIERYLMASAPLKEMLPLEKLCPSKTYEAWEDACPHEASR